MFEFVRGSRKTSIDLESVRETLLYMQSDLRNAPGLEGVAAAVGSAIAEIARVEGDIGSPKAAVVAAHFRPIDL